MNSGVVAQTEQWLKSQHHINPPGDWLEACIEWLYEENQARPLNAQQLRNAVYEQWLISDLHILESSSLPNDLSQAQKTSLNGKHCLQIDSVLDVGTPLYTQYQKVKGTQNDNVNVSATQHEPQTNPWEAKPSRMLMLQLTDGSQNIRGMEYQSIPALSTSTKPGTKILISGPVICRLGVLVLTKQNVTVLGGEVDSLVEENSQLKLIARALDQDTDEAAEPRDNNTLPYAPPPTGTATHNNNNNNNGSGVMTNTNRRTPEEMMDVADDDAFFDNIDEDELAAMDDQWEDDMNDDLLVRHADRQEPANGSGRNPLPPQPPTRRTSIKVGLTPSRLSSAKNQEDLKTSRNPSGFRQNPASVSTNRISSGGNQVGGVTSSMTVGHNNSYLIDFSDFDDADFEDGTKTEKKDFSSVGTKSNVSNALGRESTSSGQRMSPGLKLDKSTVKSIELPGSSSKSKVADDFDEMSDFDGMFFDDDDDFEEEERTFRSPNASAKEKNRQSFKKSRLNTPSGDPPKAKQAKIAPIIPIPQDVTFSDFDNDFIDLTDDDETDNLTNPSRAEPTPTVTELTIGVVNRCIESKKALSIEPGVGLDMEPYTYLSLVLKSVPFAYVTRVKVKAFISTVLSRLDHGNFTRWSLDVKINDGTATCDVSMGDKILADLIGFAAPEITQLKIRAKTDKVARKRMEDGIQNCQKKLAQLSCIMELEFTPAVTKATVVAMQPVTQQTIEHLKKRLRIS